MAENDIILGLDEKGEIVTLPARNAEGYSQAWQKSAIIGISGSGKSYAAGVIVEGWIRAEIPICVIDPVGLWWGIKLSADGKSESGLPVTVYGGIHGDQELPDPFEAAQRFAVKSETMVLDISELPMDALHYYVATFTEELMGPACRPTQPCHIVIEEAADIVPQSGSLSKNQKPCTSAVSRLVRVGRNHGYGVTLIVQRAADVNKKCLNMCDTLLLMRIAAGLDRKPIKDWVANNSADAEQYVDMISEMGMMQTGEAWLWSPTWVKTFTKVFVARRNTFHPGPDCLNFDMALSENTDLLGAGWRVISSMLSIVWYMLKYALIITLIASGLFGIYYLFKIIIGILLGYIFFSAIFGAK